METKGLIDSEYKFIAERSLCKDFYWIFDYFNMNLNINQL